MFNRTSSGAPAAPAIASSSSSIDLKRRRLLFSFGAGGAAAASAAVLPGTAVAQVAASEQPDTRAGYRETEHVRDYYRTTRI